MKCPLCDREMSTHETHTCNMDKEFEKWFDNVLRFKADGDMSTAGLLECKLPMKNAWQASRQQLSKEFQELVEIANKSIKSSMDTVAEVKIIKTADEQRIRTELIQELREWIVINRLISYDTTDTERLLAKLDLLEGNK